MIEKYHRTPTSKDEEGSIIRKAKAIGENARSMQLISEDACEKLRVRLNMHNDLGISPSAEEAPYELAVKDAENYLYYFFQDKNVANAKSIFEKAKEWVDKKFSRSHNYDGVTVGTFLVLKAFEMQLGGKFTEELRKVGSKEVIFAFDKQGAQVKNNLSLVARAKNRIGIIPDDQLYLKDFIGDFTKHCQEHVKPQVEVGAILGFNVIKKLWSKLKPELNPKTTNHPAK